ncbi:MAG: hypothetical protein E6J19_15965, partial [Chloroflexi bacterium]
MTTDPVVTGYDDMADGALAISQELMAGTGKTPVKAVTVAGQAYDLITCKSPCAPETTTPPWTADALRAAVLGDRHQVMYLGGHFDQGRARAADDLTLMLAPELAQSSVDLRGALIFGQGCHLAYNTVDQDRAALTLHPDWAQASARKGVVGFIGGTGYQYFGVREATDTAAVIEFGERIYLDFSRNLRTRPLAGRDPLGTGENSIGHALIDAKRSFVPLSLVGINLAGIGEKQLFETTLFGIPHVRVQTINKLTAPTETSIVPPATVQSADVSLPAFTLLDQGGYLSGPDGTTARPFTPVLPLVVENASVPNRQLVGVGFLGGTYVDTGNVTPTLRLAATETGSSAGGSFSSRVFWPQRLTTVDHYTPLTGGPTQLLVTPAQFRSTLAGSASGTERKFTALSFRLFYMAQGTSPSALPATISDVTTEVTGAALDELVFTVHVTGPASRVWLTYTLANGAEWRSFDLLQASPGVWSASSTLASLGAASPADVIFLVQAANTDGIVTFEANGGAFFSGQPVVATTTAPLRTTRLTLTVGAAPAGTLPCTGASTPCGRYGDSRSPDGRATVTIPLEQGEGTYALAASFSAEDSQTHLGSGSAAATFTIEKAPTTLTLTAPATGTYGMQWSPTATLRRASDGTPIADQSIFLVATGVAPTTGTFAAVGTTNGAGVAQFAGPALVPGTYAFRAYFGQVVTLPGGNVDGRSAIYGGQQSASATQTIGRAPLTIRANDASRPFGAANPTFTGTITGLVFGDNITATYATTATPTSPLGTYDITPTPIDPDGKLGNYTLTIVKGKLTVTPAAI